MLVTIGVYVTSYVGRREVCDGGRMSSSVDSWSSFVWIVVELEVGTVSVRYANYEVSVEELCSLCSEMEIILSTCSECYSD